MYIYFIRAEKGFQVGNLKALQGLISYTNIDLQLYGCVWVCKEKVPLNP